MILIIVIVLLVSIYFYTTRNYSYWSKRNVKYETPLPVFGNHLKVFLGLKSLAMISSDLYTKYPNEKAVGYFRGPTPELLIRDPDIVRDIMNADFAYFYPRGLGRNMKNEPLLRNILHSDGDLWKLLRQRLTPAFTTSKLKSMFPLIIKCTEKLKYLAEEIVAEGGECDAHDLMARFTTEFIGACGFGIEMDVISRENSIFRVMGRKIFERSLKDVLKFGIWDVFPIFRNMISILDEKLYKTISSIVMNIFEQRNFKPSGRNDFIDLLLDLAGKGKIVGDSIEYINPDGSPQEVEVKMDVDLLIPQVFMFFAAGFETSASVTSYTLHELAYSPDIQRKVQIEIDEVLSRYDDKLCYDAVAEMTYFQMVLKESMRLHPAACVLNRVCAKTYKISQLGITIDPGVKIIIPVQALQNDKVYFENPDEFHPKRFIDEVDLRHKYVLLPYGEGPRACIGARMGQMMSLAGLAALLRKFSVEPSKKSTRILQMNPRQNVVQAALNGIPLKLKLRKK